MSSGPINDSLRLGMLPLSCAPHDTQFLAMRADVALGYRFPHLRTRHPAEMYNLPKFG